jgi:hypothetical protein
MMLSRLTFLGFTFNVFGISGSGVACMADVVIDGIRVHPGKKKLPSTSTITVGLRWCRLADAGNPPGPVRTSAIFADAVVSL